jgi:glutaredoxin
MEIQFQEPFSSHFTIYSKSGCPNCIKVKNAIKSTNLIYNIVDCDDYIIENKIQFSSFIREKMNIHTTQNTLPANVVFPFVFYDGKYIGGYEETLQFINKLLVSFELNF